MNNTEGKKAIRRLVKATALFWIGLFIYVFLDWAHSFEVRLIIAFLFASSGSILGGPLCYLLGEGVIFLACRLSKRNVPDSVFFLPVILVCLFLCVTGIYESHPKVRYRHLFGQALPKGMEIKDVDGAMGMDRALWVFTFQGPAEDVQRMLGTLRLEEIPDPRGSQGWNGFFKRAAGADWKLGEEYTLSSNKKTQPQILGFISKDQRTVQVLLLTSGNLLHQ